MADFTALKTAIQNAIKQNGNEEITGNLLQDVLLAIVTTLGDSSINNLISALNTESNARQLGDSTLQGNINTVTSAITAINYAIANGYVYAGIATPTGTPATGRVFYLALTAGTYTNYGNKVVTQGINILRYNGSAWSLDVIASIDDAPTPSSNNLVKSGGVLDSIIKDGSAFDLSAYNGGATYADLNAALTALNALPAAYKRGGMSMKFVLSSDNKYVQYRCKTQSFSTNIEDWTIESDETLVEDSKRVVAWIDSKERLLLWIRTSDGGIDWAVGVPKPVKDYVDAKVTEIWNGNDGTQIDGLNKVIAFLDTFTSSETLKQYLNTTYGEYIEDIKHIEIETDNSGRILGGRKSNGRKFENIGFDTPDISINGVNLKTINDLQKKMDIGLDEKDRIIHYRDKDGMLHENVGIETNRIKVSPTGLEEFKEDLNIHSKYSSSQFIQFSDPHCDAGRTTRENGVNNEERMQLLAASISNAIKNEGNVDFVICTGDENIGNYYQGTRVDNITPFKTLVIDNISPKTLFLPVVGNHDPYTDEEWYNCFGFSRQYSVELSSCFIIVLDVYKGSIEWSYRPSDPEADSKGYVTGDYMQANHLSGGRDLRFKGIDNVFLENNLKKAKAIGKEVYVALHTTDYNSATDDDYSSAQASVSNFNSILDEYGCKLILQGHSHVISNYKSGEQWRCNPGWFGPINDYNYDTSPWAINVFKQDAGYFKVYNDIIAHNYVDTPRLGNVPASSTPTNLWVDNIGRAEYKYI